MGDILLQIMAWVRLCHVQLQHVAERVAGKSRNVNIVLVHIAHIIQSPELPDLLELVA